MQQSANSNCFVEIKTLLVFRPGTHKKGPGGGGGGGAPLFLRIRTAPLFPKEVTQPQNEAVKGKSGSKVHCH